MKFSIIFLIAVVLVSQASGLFLRRRDAYNGHLSSAISASTVEPAISASTVEPAISASTVEIAISASTVEPAISASTVDSETSTFNEAVGSNFFPPPPPNDANSSLTEMMGTDFGNGTELAASTVDQPNLLKREMLNPTNMFEQRQKEKTGKRSVLNMTGNEAVCSLSSGRSLITCRRPGFLLECEVASNLTSLGHFDLKGEKFRMLPEGSLKFNVSSNDDVQRVEIASWKRAGEFNDYTLVQSGHRIVLSFYHAELIQDNGFRFIDNQCWRSYVDMLRQIEPENVRLTLNISQA